MNGVVHCGMPEPLARRADVDNVRLPVLQEPEGLHSKTSPASLSHPNLISMHNVDTEPTWLVRAVDGFDAEAGAAAGSMSAGTLSAMIAVWATAASTWLNKTFSPSVIGLGGGAGSGMHLSIFLPV